MTESILDNNSVYNKFIIENGLTISSTPKVSMFIEQEKEKRRIKLMFESEESKLTNKVEKMNLGIKKNKIIEDIDYLTVFRLAKIKEMRTIEQIYKYMFSK